MSKKKSKLELVQEEAKNAARKTTKKIDELGTCTKQLYDELGALQEIFDRIRNIPSKKRLENDKFKEIRSNWKQQAEKIELDYKNLKVKNVGSGIAGVTVAGTGVAVAAFGPTAAMGIATTLGVASTGTAISTLSGAAATNAALAWLGGGALATGGGGIVAGKALLAAFGPVGWTIAGIAFASSLLWLWKRKNDRNRLEEIFTLISKRDVSSYELAIVEINERISRIKDESQKLKSATKRIRKFGANYKLMTKAHQYELGSYVNLMNSSTQLLVNPIVGLQPKYNQEDLKKYIILSKRSINDNQKDLIISFCNIFYNADIEEKDKKLLWKSFRRNRKFLSSIEMSKKDFEYSIIETAFDVLTYKHRSKNS